jgi:hypothetical protein
MDPEKLKAAIAAIKNDDGDAALALLEELLTGAPSGDAPPAPSGDVALESADPPPPPAPGEENAALAMVMRVTGTNNLRDAEAAFTSVVQTALGVADTRAAVDLTARRALIEELITLGHETPATAWQGKPELLIPAKRFGGETVPELRARVNQLKAAKGITSTTAAAPEVGTAPSDEEVSRQVKALSPDTLEAIKKRNMSPEEFIRQRNQATTRR